jgi:hypothetical protein
LTELLVELGASVPATPLAILEQRLASLDEVLADWISQQVGLIAGTLAGQRIRA